MYHSIFVHVCVCMNVIWCSSDRDLGSVTNHSTLALLSIYFGTTQIFHKQMFSIDLIYQLIENMFMFVVTPRTPLPYSYMEINLLNVLTNKIQTIILTIQLIRLYLSV